jgi:poly [ADP-ribose] polymerase
VVIPQGKPIAQKQYAKSSFDQSEYLVYSESQARLRYCCQVKI